MKEEEISRIKFLIMKFNEHMEMEGFSERTVRDYTYNLKHFFRYLEENGINEVNEINRAVIYKYQMYLYNYKSKKHGNEGRNLSLSTQSGMIIAVRSFFRYLVKRGCFLYDPASSIELPKRKQCLPKGIMSKKEIIKVLRQPDIETPIGLRDKAILEVLYSTGIRNSELRNLMVFDVDTVNLEVRINEGKNKKDRVLPLGEIAGKYIEEYKNQGRGYFERRRQKMVINQAKEITEKIKRENNLLFMGNRGKRMSVWTLDLIVDKYVKQAGIAKHITPHGIRHTFATHMLKGKASIRHIQALLGHKSVITTQKYTQVEVSDLKKELKRCHPREQER